MAFSSVLVVVVVSQESIFLEISSFTKCTTQREFGFSSFFGLFVGTGLILGNNAANSLQDDIADLQKEEFIINHDVDFSNGDTDDLRYAPLITAARATAPTSPASSSTLSGTSSSSTGTAITATAGGAAAASSGAAGTGGILRSNLNMMQPQMDGRAGGAFGSAPSAAPDQQEQEVK